MSRRKTFGVLVDWIDSSNSYQKRVLQGIRAFAQEHDCNLHILITGRLYGNMFLERNKNRIIDYISRETFDGLLVFTATIMNLSDTSAMLDWLKPVSGIPTVSISAQLPGIPSVCIDNRSGFSELIVHLFQKHNYNRIGYIGGPLDNPEAQDRKRTFLEIAASYGITLPDSHFYVGDFLIPSGKDGIVEFFDIRKLDLEVIVCANDNMALGAWLELSSRFYSVPEDIAITGFDNNDYNDLFDISISTVHQEMYKLGYTATRILFDLITKPDFNAYTCVVLPTKALIRESCGCRPDELKLEKQFLDEETTRFLISQKSVLLELITANHDHDSVIQEWTQCISMALTRNIKQRNMIILLGEIRTDVMHTLRNTDNRNTYHDLFLQMYLILIRNYQQYKKMQDLSEATYKRHVQLLSEYFSQAMISQPSFDDSLQTFSSLLDFISCRLCHVSLFSSGNGPDETSKLIYAYENGSAIDVPENKAEFKNNCLIHPEFTPDRRFELTTSMMYHNKGFLGFLTLDIDTHGEDTIESLRNRMSGILFSIINTSKLQEEIQTRSSIEKKLQEVMHELKEISIRDELTGLFNRRGFLALSDQALKHCIREGKEAIVCFVDMDGLKDINDTYGHEEGDKALKVISEILIDSFREADVISRFGGDEFAIFLSGAILIRWKPFKPESNPALR
ncbi:MAG: diguanylate cyclase [Spirochaetota bacterium]